MFAKLRNTYHNAHKWAHHHTIVVGLGLFLFSFMAMSQLAMPTGQTFAAEIEAPVSINTGERYHIETTIDAANFATLTMYDGSGNQLQSISTTLEREYEMLVISMGEEDGVGHPVSYMRDLEIQYDSDDNDILDTTLIDLFTSELNWESINLGPAISIDTANNMLYTDYGFLMYSAGPIFRNSISLSWDFMPGSELTADSHIALVDADANDYIILIGYSDGGDIVISEFNMSQEGGGEGGEPEIVGNASGTVDAISASGIQVSLYDVYTGFIEIQSSIDDSNWDSLQREYLASDPYSGSISIAIDPMVDGTYYRVIVLDEMDIMTYSNSMQYVAEAEQEGGGGGEEQGPGTGEQLTGSQHDRCNNNAGSLDIPVQECLALADLYVSTNGDGWTNKDGWFTSTSICGIRHGVQCEFIDTYRVTTIDLYNNNLAGELPSALSTLTEIIYFNVSYNQISGSLPDAWSAWTNISNFDVSSNQISGSLPDAWSAWTNISSFDVSYNQIGGSLPDAWSAWTNISTFYVPNNQISGSLPDAWSAWINISSFGVSSNQIGGSLPDAWSAWTNISTFYVPNNQIGGSLPDAWSAWTNISNFDVSDNQISGSLPDAWSAWTNISSFGVSSNQIGGSLPDAWSAWTNISSFYVSDNQISGSLPDAWSAWTNISSFYVSDNQISGVLPDAWSAWTNISNFDVSSNQISGSLPDAWANNRPDQEWSYVNLSCNMIDTTGYSSTTQTWIDTNVDFSDQCSVDRSDPQCTMEEFGIELYFGDGKEEEWMILEFKEYDDDGNPVFEGQDEEELQIYFDGTDWVLYGPNQEESHILATSNDLFGQYVWVSEEEPDFEYIGVRGCENYGEEEEPIIDRSDPQCTMEEFGIELYFGDGKEEEWMILEFKEYDDDSNPVFEIYQGGVPLQVYFDGTNWILYGAYGEELQILATSNELFGEYVWVAGEPIFDYIGVRGCENIEDDEDSNEEVITPPTRYNQGPTADYCPDGDLSPSYYDGMCEPDEEDEPEDDESHPSAESNNSTTTLSCTMSDELIDAHTFAYSVGITSVSDVCTADMYGGLTRVHAAKFLSQFATQILGKTPDTSKVCSFEDMAGQSAEMQAYAIKACQLGIMGLQQDGEPDAVFNPNKPVTRAMVGASLSRLFYGPVNNVAQDSTYAWYELHLQALQKHGIMQNISTPSTIELRGYLLLMLQRAKEKLGK